MKKINKKEFLQIAIQKQQELTENYTQRVSDMKTDTFSRNASASQTEDRHSNKLDVLQALEKELDFAQNELNYLSQLDITEENANVSPGAIVVTDTLTFFIGISTDKIEMSGTTVVGISTKAPIYANMKDLQKNDSFTFNEKTYQILDLY